jgi:FKBP-type peptidyl-prolyl cis-trans isomerase 2
MPDESEQAVSDGDLVYVNYDVWIVHPDGREDLFDTTSKELAEEHEMFDENRSYEPQPLVIGKGRIFAGWEESLRGAKVGVKATVEIPPDKGAGERDPRLVELHSIREFVREEITPEVGKEVILGKKKGVISGVRAGRFRVDFNNPLAGRTMKYYYTVAKRAESVEERVKGIIEMDYGKTEELEVKVVGQDVVIKLPDVCKYDELWFVSKYRVVSDLRDLAAVDAIRFVEEYLKKEKPTEEEPSDEEETEPVGEVKEEERVPEELPPEEPTEEETSESVVEEE